MEQAIPELPRVLELLISPCVGALATVQAILELAGIVVSV